MDDVLLRSPLLVLFTVLAVGSGLGMLRVRGFHLGAAAVLFTGLAMSAWRPDLELPEVLGMFGLALFAYCIGVTAGPSFFRALRTGSRPILTVAIALSAAGGGAALLGRAWGLDAGTVAGLYAGALTNTPALAAATERLGGAPEPTVGYSLTYVVGILGPLIGAGLVLRRSAARPTPEDLAVPSPLVNATVRVRREQLPTLGEISDQHQGRLLFSRVRRHHRVSVATEDVVLQPGDLVSVIGAEVDVATFVHWLGEPSDEHLPLERHSVDMRRIVVGNSAVAGKTIAELELPRRYGAVATRVRRGDVDLLARDDLVVQTGDRVRVTAPPDALPRVASYLGDSERAVSDINPFGLTVGLAVGVLLGLLRIPLGGTTLQVGIAGGPLLVGLVLGRLGRTGPVVWYVPFVVASGLQQLGMLLFLAVAASRAGDDLLAALRSGAAGPVLLAGLVITTFTVVFVAVLDRSAFRFAGPRTAGVLAGAMTDPVVLAYAIERTGDERVNLSYALVFPVAMVAKILIAQVLAALW